MTARTLSFVGALAVAAWAGTGAHGEDRIVLGAKGANAGSSGVTIDVGISHDQPIHAFSLAMVFDPEILTLRQITDEGTETAALGAEFFYPTIDNGQGTAILGVIFSYAVEPFTGLQLDPSPDALQRVAMLSFDIAPEAPPGNYPVELVDEIGSPPISNVFSRGGITIRPALADGTVTVNNENHFRLDSVVARPGSRIDVKALARHPGPLEAYSVAFLFDVSILTFVDATCLGTDAARALMPRTIEFFQPKFEADFSPTHARISAEAITDYVPPFDYQEVPASPDGYRSIARFRFDVKDDPALMGTTTELTLHNGGVTDSNNMIVVDGKSYEPALEHGSVTFTAATTFRRGMVNGDSRLDISDGIVMLGYLFLGLQEPACMQACDINDDDRADLSDAIWLFNYLFTGGARPKDPFEICGVDPTPDDLSCLISTGCP